LTTAKVDSETIIHRKEIAASESTVSFPSLKFGLSKLAMTSRRLGKWIVFVALCAILVLLFRSLMIAHSTFYELLLISTPTPISVNTNNVSRIQHNESFSTCLLVMDENFRLYEWLAYHYHVLPLRYVVIAVDPRSALNPEPVLDLFRDELNMTIITWTDSDFVDWAPLSTDAPPRVLTNRYVMRQRIFLGKCMEHLYQQGQSWTALWDVDEYIIFNGYNRSVDNITTPNDLAEPGNILEYIQKAEEKPCYPMMKLEVGTKEDPSVRSRSISIPNLDPHRFDTLRYQYKNRFGNRGVGNLIGKAFLDVRKMDFPHNVISIHRPSTTICPPPHGGFVNGSPFLLLHYVGSWESFSFRTKDARNGSEREEFWRKRTKLSHSHEPNTATWLEGFIQNVGKQRASRLLRHAGLPRGYNGSVSHYDALIAAEEKAAMT
jgi:hypothetical protein